MSAMLKPIPNEELGLPVRDYTVLDFCHCTAIKVDCPSYQDMKSLEQIGKYETTQFEWQEKNWITKGRTFIEIGFLKDCLEKLSDLTYGRGEERIIIKVSVLENGILKMELGNHSHDNKFVTLGVSSWISRRNMEEYKMEES